MKTNKELEKFSFGWVIFWAIFSPPIAIIYLAYKLK